MRNRVTACACLTLPLMLWGLNLAEKIRHPDPLESTTIVARSRTMASWAVQIITLLAVALGALASFVSTRAIERSRWRREEMLRWDTKRLECYSDFSAAMIRFITVGDRIAAGLGLPAVVEPLDRKSGLPALASAEADLSLYWTQLLILGSPEVVTAAQDWRNQAWLAESFALGHQSGAIEFEAVLQSRREARGRFYGTVRADLGVTSGDIPADIGWRAPINTKR